MNTQVAVMCGFGATTALMAPGLLLAIRDRLVRYEPKLHPLATMVGFLLLHASVTITMSRMGDHPMSMVGLWLVLLAGGVVFWLPVFGRRNCLAGSGRCAYLFIAAPSLDLAAVYPISTGHELQGLAMIVGMLPIGGTAMALTWQLAIQEERAAQRAESLERHLGHMPSQLITAEMISGIGDSTHRAPTRHCVVDLAGRREPGSRRLLRVGLGALWVLDGILQSRPSLFSDFVAYVIRPNWSGQPRWLTPLGSAAGALWQLHPRIADASASAIELLLGIGIILGGERRVAQACLYASAVCAGVIWISGEAVGEMLRGGASWISGAPGAALIYAGIALFLARTPSTRWDVRAKAHLGAAIGVFFLLGAAVQGLPWEGFWSGRVLAGVFASGAMHLEPSVARRPVQALVAAVTAHPRLANAASVATLASLGLGLLRGRNPRFWLGLAGVWLAFTWWAGMGLGILAPGATDPNTAVPVAILVGSAWACLGESSSAEKAQHSVSAGTGRH